MTQSSKSPTPKDSELRELQAIRKDISEIKEGMLAFFTGFSRALGSEKVDNINFKNINKKEEIGIEENLKNHIEVIKENISKSMTEIVKAEKKYDLNLAAEIKYGKLVRQQAHLERMEIELKNVAGM